MVDFTLDAELVIPCHAGRSVAEELRIHVGGFCHPIVEGVLLDGVGAGIAGGVGVDDTGCIDGDHTIIGIAEVALRNLNFVGVDALKDARDQQFHIVSKDGGERGVRTIDAICFVRFSSDVAPADVGVTRAIKRIWDELSREQNRLVGWLVVLNHRIAQSVLAYETDVLVIFVWSGVIGEEIGDGIVTVPFGVRRHRNDIFRFGSVENRDGCFRTHKVGAQFTGDLVIRSPKANLHGIRARFGQYRVNGVVIQPLQRCFAGRSIKLCGDDERRVNWAGLFENRFVRLGGVENEFSRFRSVAERGRDGVVERSVHSRCDWVRHRVARVRVSFAVERVSASTS